MSSCHDRCLMEVIMSDDSGIRAAHASLNWPCGYSEKIFILLGALKLKWHLIFRERGGGETCTHIYGLLQTRSHANTSIAAFEHCSAYSAYKTCSWNNSFNHITHTHTHTHWDRERERGCQYMYKLFKWHMVSFTPVITIVSAKKRALSMGKKTIVKAKWALEKK